VHRTDRISVDHRRERILFLTRQGKTAREISDVMGMCIDAIYYNRKVLKRVGLLPQESLLKKIHGTHEGVDDREREVLVLTQEGESTLHIAECVGVAPRTVTRIRRRLRAKGKLA
jgi:DNA-binding CsgD family transcriptional regulator